MSALLAFHLVLFIMLLQSDCFATVLGPALCSNASHTSVSLGTTVSEYESLVKNYNRRGRASTSRSRLLNKGAASRNANPWLRQEEDLFDSRLRQDMRDMPESFQLAPSNSSDFVSAVQAGRCKANCLMSFAPELGQLHNDRGFLVPADCGTSVKCQLCEQACEVPHAKCYDHCDSVSVTLN